MAQETETPSLELAMVSCTGCDAVFMASERRQTCPACGGEAVGPYFEFVLDGSGLHRKDGATPAAAQPPPAEEPAPEPEVPAAEAPAEEEEEAVPATASTLGALFPAHAESFLRGGEVIEDDLRHLLADLGADPEAAAAAVGRLVAVRDLVRELAEIGVEAQVEVAVEETPAEAPEPESGPENAPETP